LDIFDIAEKEDEHTQRAAKIFAKNRIETINHLRANYVKR
jgi:leucine dehydrogenase